MLKRLFCLLLTMMLLPLAPAMAAESNADTLTYQELLAWAETFKARAMTAEPLNDPEDARSQTEDGWMFVYEFATLYMDRPEMSEESVLQGLVINDYEVEGLRGTRVDDTVQSVLDAFYTENPGLVGNRTEATLYTVDSMPDSALIGRVQRDGQRLQTVEYITCELQSTGGDGYTYAGLVYTIQAGNVAAIRVWGLNDRVPADTVLVTLDQATALAEESAYSQVEISFAGVDLEPFNTEDLFFAGIDFATLTPEMAQAALGDVLQDTWLDNGDGYLRVMEFVPCEITFLYNEEKTACTVDTLMIRDDAFEGPRSVRLGDQLSSVLNRFRHSEGSYDEETGVEVLYGSEASGVWGTATYGNDATATLHYSLMLPDGSKAVLYLYFAQLRLSDILLYRE